MTNPARWLTIQELFTNAPCNVHLAPVFEVGGGFGRVTIHIRPDMLHGGGVVHGSIIFKTLDDAATIAGMSLMEDDGATLTSSFNIYFMRPIVSGTLIATGQVIRMGRRQIISEAVAVNEKGKEIARGSGIFMPVQE